MTSLHQFLEMMATERRVTRSTISAYDADLRSFYEFLKGQKVECVTLQSIQGYLLTQKHLSTSTLARRLSSLRQFYTYLMQRGIVKENPFSLVKATQDKPKSPPFLSEKDVKRLLEGAKSWKGAEGKRLSALLQILYEADMSVNELVSLPLDVMLEAQFTATAREVLQEYISIRSYFLTREKESPWLFPSSSQKGHLTRQRFGQLLKELALKIGLDSEHISLTRIRHSFTCFRA